MANCSPISIQPTALRCCMIYILWKGSAGSVKPVEKAVEEVEKLAERVARAAALYRRWRHIRPPPLHITSIRRRP